jgi:hypothetical protein
VAAVNAPPDEALHRTAAVLLRNRRLVMVFLPDVTAKSKWVGLEIEKSIEMGKHVLGVYPQDAEPTSLPAAFSANKIKCVPWPELASTIANLK